MTDQNHCDDKSSNSNCECQCVETLAKILKRRKGDNIFLFERDGARVSGNIKDVVNNSALILEPIDQNPQSHVEKRTCLCDGGTNILLVKELVISICEITEFSPYPTSNPQLAPQIKPATKGWFKGWFKG